MKTVGFCLFICAITFSAFGVGGVLPGNGSSATPYLIEDLADFQTFADPANSATYWSSGVYTKLTADIDLSSVNYSDSVIAPDTDPSNTQYQGTPYRGNFDGNGYEIQNLTIDDNDAGLSNIGLFGGIESGNVENLGVVNCTIIAGNPASPVNRSVISVGTLCGHFYVGSITNCYSTGSITVDLHCTADYGQANALSIGGLCGYFTGNITGSSSSCSITINISSYYSSTIDGIGGLCGYADGTISQSSSTGNISATVSKSLDKYTYIIYNIKNVGGFTGNSYAAVDHSYSTGNVNCVCSCYDYSLISFIGGFAGYSPDNISNCYTRGSVSASAVGGRRYAGVQNLGGFAGSNNASITNCYAAGGFSSSAQSNNVQSILNNGGFCSAGNGSFTSCFWDTDLSGAASSTYGTGLATSLMQSQSTFTAAGWDFDDSDGSADWYMPAGGYPELQWQLVNPVDLEEFGILAQYWGDTGCVSGQDCFAADWYVDGTIDTLDLTQLTESWLSDGIMISGN